MNKIVSNLSQLRNNQKNKIVLCYGHFNVIHPGHIQYFEYSKNLGNTLVLAVRTTEHNDRDYGSNYFPLKERCKGLSSINIIDHIIPLEELDILQVINSIKPSYFVLGKEHENSEDQVLNNAIKTLDSLNGQMVYYKGSFHKSNSEYFFDNVSNIEKERIKKLILSSRNQKIEISNLIYQINNFSSSSLLVVGDTIVDQYIDCNALGMSSEAPVIVVKEKESKGFLGGAAIVAAHAKCLGAKCKYISVAGNDHVYDFVKKELSNLKIESFIIRDDERPTTFKTRYLVENQKVFRVSKIDESSISKDIEDEIISKVESEIKNVNGILVSDFVYGVITERVLNQIMYLAKKNKVLLFGDLQCSSQVGDIKKFKNFDLICPTEKEARIALGSKDFSIEWLANKIIEKTNSKNLIMKLGGDGFVAYETKTDNFVNRQHFPALNVNPLDVTGAGDSLLAALSVGISSGSSIMESSIIAAVVASLAVQNMGNIPINKKQLIEYIKDIERYE